MEQDNTSPTGKPLQTIPWAKKVEKKGNWFIANAEYFIGVSRFVGRTRSNRLS